MGSQDRAVQDGYKKDIQIRSSKAAEGNKKNLEKTLSSKRGCNYNFSEKQEVGKYKKTRCR